MRKPFTQLYCHLVRGTWNRLPLVRPEMEPRLYTAIGDKALELQCVPVAIGGTEDHLHCLISFHPTVAISYLVQQIKGASSHLMTHELIGPENFKWQGAYGAFTLGADGIEPVRAYILNQKRHHADGEVWQE